MCKTPMGRYDKRPGAAMKASDRADVQLFKLLTRAKSRHCSVLRKKKDNLRPDADQLHPEKKEQTTLPYIFDKRRAGREQEKQKWEREGPSTNL